MDYRITAQDILDRADTVERVARAICGAGCGTFDRMEHLWTAHEAEARAAIRAMTPPGVEGSRCASGAKYDGGTNRFREGQ
jgi:hypothetical protein